MAGLLQTQTQAAFRVSTYRMQHGIDIRPSKEAVESFHELLLAEAELMVGGTQQDVALKPSVKAMATLPTTPQRDQHHVGGSICRWWGSENGCRAARNCKFLHPPLEDKMDRWLGMQWQGPSQADCPHRGSGDQPGGSEAMGASAGKDGKDPSAMKGKARKGGGKGSPKGHTKGAKEEQHEKSGHAATPPTASMAPGTRKTEKVKESPSQDSNGPERG